MLFNTGAALLDAIVLAVVAREPEGTYGYKITQEVRQVIELSESTLYPVLRRLQKDECLEVYDRECSGRTRRYYKVYSRRIWTVMHPLHQQAVFPAMIMTVRPAHGTAVRRQEKLC